MSRLLLGAALASVDTATHEGTVAGERIEWVSTFHGRGNVCAPVLPSDTVRSARVSDGIACAHGGTMEIRRSQARTDELRPPMVADGIHRITVRGSYITPDDSLGLTKTVGGWSEPAVTRADRMAFDSNLFRHGPRKLHRAMYLRNPRHTSLPVSFADSTISPVAPLLMGGGLLGVLVLGGLAYRSLDRMARRERVNSWLDDDQVRGELQRDGIR